MKYKSRRDTTRVTKGLAIGRHRKAKDHGNVSFVRKHSVGEELLKAKRYIRNALDFGIDSGYLRPSNGSRKILRVSSDLISSRMIRGAEKCDGTCSHVREKTPMRFDEYEVQDARRRRRRRGRRRSRSRSRRGRRKSRRRGRRRSGSQNPEEVGEDLGDDYDMENGDEKRQLRRDEVDRDKKVVRTSPQDIEKTAIKKKDEGSDLSVDEDETDDDDDEDKDGRSNPTKS